MPRKLDALKLCLPLGIRIGTCRVVPPTIPVNEVLAISDTSSVTALAVRPRPDPRSELKIRSPVHGPTTQEVYHGYHGHGYGDGLALRHPALPVPGPHR